jgi:hypothetical protein
VAVEQVKGALVCMLRKYECLHPFPLSSTMSAAMRKALYPSGAKDDPRNVDLLLGLLVQHRDRLRYLQPENEETWRVQNLVEERRKLVDEKTARINRLIGYLKTYFPQMLQWFERLDTKLAFAGEAKESSTRGAAEILWALAPCPEKPPNWPCIPITLAHQVLRVSTTLLHASRNFSMPLPLVNASMNLGQRKKSPLIRVV